MSLHEDFIAVMHFIGIVGEVEDNGEEKSYFMWAHKKFDIGYSDNQVRHNVFVTFYILYVYAHIIYLVLYAYMHMYYTT